MSWRGGTEESRVGRHGHQSDRYYIGMLAPLTFGRASKMPHPRFVRPGSRNKVWFVPFAGYTLKVAIGNLGSGLPNSGGGGCKTKID